MKEMMAGLFMTTQINSCYVALPQGVMIMMDDQPSSKYDENGSLISIPIRQRAWYTGTAEKIQT